MVQVIEGNFNWGAIVISALCIIFLILVRLINQKLWKFSWYKKLPIPIPSQLIAVSVYTVMFCVYYSSVQLYVSLNSLCYLLSQVAVATLVASLIKVDDRYDVEVVGNIPTGYSAVILCAICFSVYCVCVRDVSLQHTLSVSPPHMSSFFIISTKFYAKLVQALTGINLFYLVWWGCFIPGCHL